MSFVRHPRRHSWRRVGAHRSFASIATSAWPSRGADRHGICLPRSRSTYLPHDLPGPGQVGLGIDLGRADSLMPQDGLRGFEAESPPDLGADGVPETIRRPGRDPGLLAGPRDRLGVRVLIVAISGRPFRDPLAFSPPLAGCQGVLRSARRDALRASRAVIGLKRSGCGSSFRHGSRTLCAQRPRKIAWCWPRWSGLCLPGS